MFSFPKNKLDVMMLTALYLELLFVLNSIAVLSGKIDDLNINFW